MESIFLQHLSWLMPLIAGIGTIIWLLFAFHSIKLLSGIKKELGIAHYTLPNRWPSYDNPETRAVVDGSEALTNHKQKRAYWANAFLGYLLIVVAPVLGTAFYLNYAN